MAYPEQPKIIIEERTNLLPSVELGVWHFGQQGSKIRYGKKRVDMFTDSPLETIRKFRDAFEELERKWIAYEKDVAEFQRQQAARTASHGSNPT